MPMRLLRAARGRCLGHGPGMMVRTFDRLMPCRPMARINQCLVHLAIG